MTKARSIGERLIEEARAFVRAGMVFLPIWIVFNTVGWAQYSIPSESMAPTLEVGDEAHPTGVVLEAGVVETLRRGVEAPRRRRL